MEKAAAKGAGDGTKDRGSPVRLMRQAKAKAAPTQADEETILPQAVAEPSPAAVPGQVPEPLPASRGSSRKSSRKPTPVSSPTGQKRAVASAEPEVTDTAPPTKSEPKRTNLSPEHVGKIKRPTDDQQQRYQQHLAYLKGMDGNAYRMAVEGESGAIEAELASMLQGLKEDLREKVPLLPEVEAMEQTATTSAESQVEDSPSETSGAGYRPSGLPTPNTVESLSHAMDEEIWNKLRQQLRSLQDNIDEITAKFSPLKTSTLSASGGTCAYPSKTPQSARSHRDMDMRFFAPPPHQMSSHIQSGRFQRVSHSQLPQTPQSVGSDRLPQAWHLQSHLPDHIIHSNATSESSTSVRQAGSCRRASRTSSASDFRPAVLPGIEADLLCSPSRAALCPAIPGCQTRSTSSLNSVAPPQLTPGSAKLTLRAVPLEIAGAPAAAFPSGDFRAQSPGRPFVMMRPMTPQQVTTPRLYAQRRVFQTAAGPVGGRPES